MNQQDDRRVRGMTLLEVMAALLLLGIGVMGTAAMLDISRQSNTRAQQGVADTMAAAMLVERILALPYDDPRLKDTDGGFSPDSPDHGPVAAADRSSTIEWEVDRDFPVPNTKRVLVTIRTFGRTGAVRKTKFDTLKARDLVPRSSGMAPP